MTLIVNNLTGFGAAPVAAGGVSTLTKQTHTHSPTDSMTLPADINAGDLIVMFGYAAGSSVAPTVNTPSGWTKLGQTSSGFASIAIWYKIATGSDASSSHSGFFTNEAFPYLGCLTFRPDNPITAVDAVGSYQGQITDGDPASQTIPSSAGFPVLVALGNTIGTLTMTPNDGTVNDASLMYMGWKIYTASPANVTADSPDEGSENSTQSCFFEVS